MNILSRFHASQDGGYLTHKKMKIIFVDIIIFGSKVIFSIVIFRLYKCYIRLYRYFQVIQAKIVEKIQNYTDYFHYT